MANKKSINSKISGTNKKSLNNKTTKISKSTPKNPEKRKTPTPKVEKTDGIKNIKLYLKKALNNEKIDAYNKIIADINKRMGILQQAGYAPTNTNYQKITEFLYNNPEVAKMNPKGELRFRKIKEMETHDIDKYLRAAHGFFKYNLSTKTMKEDSWINKIMYNIYGEDAPKYSKQQLNSIERIMQVVREMKTNINDFELLEFDSEAVSMWAANNYERSAEDVIKRLLEISAMPQKQWLTELEKDIKYK